LIRTLRKLDDESAKLDPLLEFEQAIKKTDKNNTIDSDKVVFIINILREVDI
jgi:hypothetical protein